MVKETQLYDLLEVSTEADEQEIRRAYKALALKYHPDKQPSSNNGGDKEKMTEMFKAVSKAYDILSDNNKRYLYDTYGEEVAVNPQEQTSVFSTDNHHYDHNVSQYQHHQQQQQQQHHNHQNHQHARQNNVSGFPSAFSAHNMMNSHFSSTNEIFNHIFNDFGSNNFMNSFKAPFGSFGNSSNSFQDDQSHHNTMAKGKDIMDTVYCSLLDYYNGKHIKMSLCKRIKCPKCKGSGGLKIYTCNDCCGSGYIINESRNGMMYQRTQSTCARCQGTGEFIPAKYTCDECGGNKLVDTKVIFNFKSPRGVSDGYRVVFPNAADEGVNLIPGDVVLTLKDDVNDKTLKYRRFGNDLLTTISIPLVKALCGGRISLNHIDGKKINIFVACGEIKSANELKVLKGYGMPIHKSTSSSKPDSINNNKMENKSELNSENTSGNMSNNASENNVNNKDKPEEKVEYGDLIIKFEISFPDITAFSSKRVDLLGKVLGSTFPTDGIQLGGVSSSSSSEDIPSSADDLSSFRMGSRNESSMSSLAKNLKLSDSDATSPNFDISKKRALDAANDEIRYRSSNSDDSGRVRTPAARSEKLSSNAMRLQDLVDQEKTGLTLRDFPAVTADIVYDELDLSNQRDQHTASSADPTNAGENPYKRMKGNELS